MRITTIHFPHNQVEDVINAAKFYASILMEEYIHNDIHLEIHLKQNMDHYGQCHNDDFLVKYPKFFRIDLQDMEDFEDVLYNLAHEMVHLKQYALGQLTLQIEEFDKKTKEVKIKPLWENQSIQFREQESPYWDSPWEIEAYGRQLSLYERFIEYKNGD